MGELVEHVEHPILASVVGAVFDKVVGPDMIAVLRPQPNARSVGQPEPAALGLLMGNFQPLTLPDTLDPLVVDYPARLGQELGDLAIAIAAVLPGKLDNICSSSRPRGTLRCVERCCSETCSCARTCSMQARRRAGLRSFPGQPPAERAYLASDRKPPCAAGRVPDSVAMYQCLKTKDLQADIRSYC
jgi:hypothetical protein